MAELAEGLMRGADGRVRCAWHNGLADYMAYHDQEWGRPVSEDRRLFEKLCLEGFQAGLSWLTILRKRANFRRAFADFDAAALARFGPAEVERLLADSGIVRHRGKILAVLGNARAALELTAEAGSLAAYLWRFAPEPAERPDRLDHATLRRLTQSRASVALSRELRRRGWRFVGPTTCYAFMQSVGMVNDHLEGCWCRPEIEAARQRFIRPGN
jgi:DNA-3-methyladenine glycosylase I